MRGWPAILAGLAVWAAHFVAVYAIASVWPGQPRIATWLVIAMTTAAIVANVAILWRLARVTTDDDLDRWVIRLAQGGAALSLVAVAFQTVPALYA